MSASTTGEPNIIGTLIRLWIVTCSSFVKKNVHSSLIKRSQNSVPDQYAAYPVQATYEIIQVFCYGGGLHVGHKICLGPLGEAISNNGNIQIHITFN